MKILIETFTFVFNASSNLKAVSRNGTESKHVTSNLMLMRKPLVLCIFCIKEIIAFVQKLIIFSKQMHYTVDEEKEKST